MRKSVKAGAVVLSIAAIASQTHAAVLNLTTAGTSGVINGAIFEQVDPQTTGTGVINPFVRIQANGVEQGYNTDGRPVEFDEHTDNFTRSLNIADLSTVLRDSTVYTRFMLDINEPSAENSVNVSLDSLKIFVANSPDITNFSSLTQLAYDMDATGDYSVLLNAALNSGSGSGDMLAWIPYDLLVDPDNTYIYVYSKFTSSQGGFEEWSTFGVGTAEAPPETPLPSAFLAASAVIGFVARSARRFRKSRER